MAQRARRRAGTGWPSSSSLALRMPRGRKNFVSARWRRSASSMRTWDWDRMFSQMRGGADLSEVLSHGGGVLGTVHRTTGEEGHGHREEAVADPGHGQVGHELVAFVEGLDLQEAPRRADKRAVRDHHALGEARGPRGVVDDGEIARAALADLRLPESLVLGGEAQPELLDAVEAQEERVVVVTHALRIVVDHQLRSGELVLHLEDLVDLLLVFTHDHARLGVVDHVVHLGGDRVLVHGHRRTAQGLRGEHGPIELRAVVTDHRDLVAAPEAQRGQSQGDALDMASGILPGVGLPDAEFLLTDRDTAVAP